MNFLYLVVQKGKKSHILGLGTNDLHPLNFLKVRFLLLNAKKKTCARWAYVSVVIIARA